MYMKYVIYHFVLFNYVQIRDSDFSHVLYLKYLISCRQHLYIVWCDTMYDLRQLPCFPLSQFFQCLQCSSATYSANFIIAFYPFVAVYVFVCVILKARLSNVTFFSVFIYLSFFLSSSEVMQDKTRIMRSFLLTYRWIKENP